MGNILCVRKIDSKPNSLCDQSTETSTMQFSRFPSTVRRRIVENLDYNSRLNLKRTSHDFKLLVDSVPYIFNRIKYQSPIHRYSEIIQIKIQHDGGYESYIKSGENRTLVERSRGVSFSVDQDYQQVVGQRMDSLLARNYVECLELNLAHDIDGGLLRLMNMRYLKYVFIELMVDDPQQQSTQQTESLRQLLSRLPCGLYGFRCYFVSYLRHPPLPFFDFLKHVRDSLEIHNIRVSDANLLELTAEKCEVGSPDITLNGVFEFIKARMLSMKRTSFRMNLPKVANFSEEDTITGMGLMFRVEKLDGYYFLHLDNCTMVTQLTSIAHNCIIGEIID